MPQYRYKCTKPKPVYLILVSIYKHFMSILTKEEYFLASWNTFYSGTMIASHNLDNSYIILIHYILKNVCYHKALMLFILEGEGFKNIPNFTYHKCTPHSYTLTMW